MKNMLEIIEHKPKEPENIPGNKELYKMIQGLTERIEKLENNK